MVEFNFDIKPLFPQPIIRVRAHHILPRGRLPQSEVSTKLSAIVDHMGQLSAVAQGLLQPVTSTKRMVSNHTIYLLADTMSGFVTGLLKVGTKDLYLFDEGGERRKLEATPAILDFYVHESRQRTGQGKLLFDAMLAKERWTPEKCSVDRPSDKLMAFLSKHYGLSRTIPQANNFVLFEGFFGDGSNTNTNTNTKRNPANLGNRSYYGSTTCLGHQAQLAPLGRYGAQRPVSSMAEIMRSGNGRGTGRRDASRF